LLNAVDLQRQTLRLYGEFMARHATYGGRLVLCYGEGSSATGLPTAVSIAGGTTLALDPNASVVKSVFRQGGIDFVVNTLDESLRVLKNEIRQHKPLSVGLIADLDLTLAEMQERGLLPDIHVTIDAPMDGSHFGRESIHLSRSDGLVEPSSLLASWLQDRGWEEVVLPTSSLAELRTRDAQLLALIPATDTLRRTWVQRISHYQRSSPGSARAVWFSPEERAAL
jgi:hypothetical protein